MSDSKDDWLIRPADAGVPVGPDAPASEVTRPPAPAPREVPPPVTAPVPLGAPVPAPGVPVREALAPPESPARRGEPAPRAPGRPKTEPEIPGYEVLGLRADGALEARAPDGRPVLVFRLGRELRLAAASEALGRAQPVLGDADGFAPVLAVGATDEGEAYVVEANPGVETLGQRLRRGPASFDGAIATARLLARALGRAHARGVVHGALSPACVVVDPIGRPFVSGHGAGELLRQQPRAAPPAVDRAVYAAPEQGRDRPLTPAADVHAIGAILYECLAGRAAYSARNEATARAHAATGNRMPLLRARPQTPRWLAAVVDRALARDPAARFADGRDLARALEGAPGADTARTVRLGAGLVLGLVASMALGLAAQERFMRRPTPTPRPSPPVLPVTPTSPTFVPPPVPPPRPIPEPPRPTPRAAVVPERPREPALDPTVFRSGRAVLVGLARTTVEPRDDRGPVCVAVTLDGTRAITGNVEGRLRVWDLARAEVVSEVEGSGAVTALALAPDARRALVARGTELCLCDLERGSTVQRFEGHQGAIRAVAFSPDGARGLSGGDDRDLFLWDLESGSSLRRLAGHAREVTAVAFTADGERAVSAGRDGQLRVCDLARGRTTRTVAIGAEARRSEGLRSEPSRTDSARQETVLALALDAKGSLALAIGADLSTRTFDLRGGFETQLPLELEPTSRAVLPFARERSQTPAIGVAIAKGVALVLRESGEALGLADAAGRRLTLAWRDAGPIALSPSGSAVLFQREPRMGSFAGLGRDGFASPEADGPRVRFPRCLAGDGSCGLAALSPDGARALLASDERVERVELGASPGRTVFPGFGPGALALWLEGNDAAVAFPSGVLFARGDDLARRETGARPTALAVHGSWVAVGTHGGKVLVSARDASSAARAFSLRTDATVTALAFSHDGTLLAAGSADGEVRLFEAGTLRLLRTLPSHKGAVSALAFARDGLRLASGGGDLFVIVAEVGTGTTLDRVDLAGLGPWFQRSVADANGDARDLAWKPSHPTGLAWQGRLLLVGSAAGLALLDAGDEKGVR